MGADVFETISLGKTPEEAFVKAVREAQYDYGHSGYTGTIAEKSGYILFILEPRTDLRKLVGMVDRSMDASWSQDPKAQARAAKAYEWLSGRVRGGLREAERMTKTYEDKWGPAVCVEVKGAKATQIKEKHGRKGTHDKVYLFFGYASC